MLLIGENLNVMVKKIGTAMKERDPKPIQELAIAEANAGVDYIDINLGPARKGGGELMAWVVKTVQEAVDTPLYLDTINAEAIEAGLQVYKNKKGKTSKLIHEINVAFLCQHDPFSLFRSLRELTRGKENTREQTL